MRVWGVGVYLGVVRWWVCGGGGWVCGGFDCRGVMVGFACGGVWVSEGGCFV